MRAYDAKRQRESRARRGPSVRRFAGVDGEGGNINGEHRYLLLRAGDHMIRSADGETELTSEECLAFLANRKPGVTYVAYFFDYDATMILRHLPEERLRRLMDRSSRIGRNGQAMPIDYGPFQIDYLPRKFLKVRWRGGHWVEVNDVGTFFQCSFLRALTDWDIATPEVRAQIAKGKDSRRDFGKLDRATVHYNHMECNLLVALMVKFRETCRDVGYLPSKWQGPGYLAVSMFRKHGIPKTKELTFPEKVLTLANSAYYGGRFETTMIGRYDRPVYQYDINSAYPDAISDLPCLLHGHWEPNDGGDLVLLDVHFTPWNKYESTVLYGLPVRGEDGGIYFPGEGNGTYWKFELDAAIHQAYEVKETWSFYRECTHRPFEFVLDVYEERVALGKQAKGKVLKLALNSLYGKTAQSIGGAPYANPVYASLITARTRVKLAEAIHGTVACRLGHCGDNVLMLATDAVFSSQELTSLSVSKDLGEWDLEVHTDGMFVIQPGIYWTSDPGKPKTRGIPQSKVVEYADEFVHQLHRLYAFLCEHRTEFPDMDAYRVRIPLRTFISLRQALARNNLPSAGTWPEVEKNVSYDWRSKRGGYYLQETHIRTLPLDGGPDVHSVPYGKAIGNWAEVFRFDSLDQPDFGSETFTGEG